MLMCLQTAWQEHKSQLGREAGQDASLLKMSSGFREATAAHFRTYAAVTLEELAVETGAAEDHLTPDILEAFRKLRHSIVCSLRFFLFPPSASLCSIPQGRIYVQGNSGDVTCGINADELHRSGTSGGGR